MPTIANPNKKVACKGFNQACHRWFTPGKMCPGCYAWDSYLQYPNVRIRWEANALLTDNERVEQVCHDLQRTRPSNREFFRIHSAGEFRNVPELMSWAETSSNFPATQFFTYSKEPWLGNELDRLPPNLIVRWNTAINYGSMEWCLWMMDQNPGRYWICPCGQPGVDNKRICVARCRACATAPRGRLPLFIKH